VKASDLATVVREMEGRMPESSRSLLAHKILMKLSLTLRERDVNLFNRWHDSGAPTQFIKDCAIKNENLPNVPHDIQVHDGELAQFCNRWMNMEQFRESGGEWKPVTPEMHSLRCTMIQELKTLSEIQKENADST